jgi:hypothetical protein
VSPTVAYRRAAVLRYAAIQFVVLSVCAMAAYAGGTWFDPRTPHYLVTANFLSDLGATRAFSGRSNYISAALFVVAVVTVGVALIGFAWCWREIAFARGRARIAGHASAVLATASGVAFIALAFAPVNVALNVHNTFTIAAFALLTAYVATLTFVMVRNGIGGVRLAVNLAYLALITGYVVVVLRVSWAPPHGHEVQVVAQKLAVYGSMLHAIYLTTSMRRSIATKLGTY